MNKMIYSIRIIGQMILFFIIYWPSVLYAQIDENIVVSYTLEDSLLSLSQPLILELSVYNNSSKPINLDLGPDLKANFIFTVTWPNGITVQLPQWWREGIARIGEISVAAESQFSERFVLNEWSDFRELGKYTLEIKLATSIQSEDGNKIQEVRPYSTSFEILPRDEEVLVKKCEEWIKIIETSSSSKEDKEAALALSYIRDPIAIPYMKRALDSGSYVENQIMDGLARISNWSAVKLLISIIDEVDENEIANINSSAGTRARQALFALHRIEQQTSDLGMKQLIQQTLQKFN